MADKSGSESKSSEGKDDEQIIDGVKDKPIVMEDDENVGRKRKEGRNKKSFAIPTDVSLKDKNIDKERAGPYNQFRRNLASQQEAYKNHQYDLGSNEIKKEDIEFNHDQDHGILHMRSNWHDGTTASEYDELLQDADISVSNGDHGKRGNRGGGDHTRNQLVLAKKQQHYVESATGIFKRVGSRSLQTRNNLHRHNLSDGSSEDVYAKYYRAKAALDPCERTMWLFAQGLLAGFSSAPVLLQWSTPNDQNFISSYRRISNSVRRILFLLCMVAAAGAIDQLKQALRPSKMQGLEKVKKWKERGREERVLLWLSALVYLSALSATLICSVTDAVISQKAYFQYASKASQASATGWEDYALNYDETGNFQGLLDQWYGSNAVRFFCALAGWLIVVRLHFLKLIDHSTANSIETLTQKLSGQVDLCRKLRSDIPVLENMSFSEIHRLHDEQQRAADITALILSQEHHLTANTDVSLV